MMGSQPKGAYWERSLLAQANGNLGWLARTAGDLAEARRCYEESLARWGLGAHDALTSAYVLLHLCEVAAESGDAALAKERHGECVELARQLGETWLERRVTEVME